MKIALFTWGVADGAFSNVAAGLTHALSSRGVVPLDLLHIAPQGELPPGKFAQGTRFHRIAGGRALFSIPHLVRYLRKERPDVLISMPSYINVASIMARLLSRWNGRLIISEHASMSAQAQGDHKGELVLGYMPYYARLLYRYADALVGVSKGVVDDLRFNVGIEMPRMRVIANPVDLNFVRAASVMGGDSDWLQKPRVRPCFITVGRLEREKGVETLLDAWALLDESHRPRLLIVGDGSLRPSLERRIDECRLGDSVRILGWQSNPYPLIAGADALILPSREEGFGLVLVEALALGTPVVAMDALGGGPREILQEGRFGMLVEQRTAEGLARAVRSFIEDPRAGRRYRRLGLIRAAGYDPQNVGAQWHDLFRDLGVNEA